MSEERSVTYGEKEEYIGELVASVPLAEAGQLARVAIYYGSAVWLRLEQRPSEEEPWCPVFAWTLPATHSVLYTIMRATHVATEIERTATQYKA